MPAKEVKTKTKKMIVDIPGPGMKSGREGVVYNKMLGIKIDVGELGKHGYALKYEDGRFVPDKYRFFALKKAVKEYGVDEVYKKLNYLKMVNKHNPKHLKYIVKDMAFLRLKYPKEFTKPLEKSDIWDDIQRLKISIRGIKRNL